MQKIILLLFLCFLLPIIPANVCIAGSNKILSNNTEQLYEEIGDDGKHYFTVNIYQDAVFAQNTKGEWVKAFSLASIDYNGDIVFKYGEKIFTLNPIIETNTLKAPLKTMNITFTQENKGDYYKFGIKICSLPISTTAAKLSFFFDANKTRQENGKIISEAGSIDFSDSPDLLIDSSDGKISLSGFTVSKNCIEFDPMYTVNVPVGADGVAKETDTPTYSQDFSSTTMGFGYANLSLIANRFAIDFNVNSIPTGSGIVINDVDLNIYIVSGQLATKKDTTFYIRQQTTRAYAGTAQAKFQRYNTGTIYYQTDGALGDGKFYYLDLNAASETKMQTEILSSDRIFTISGHTTEDGIAGGPNVAATSENATVQFRPKLTVVYSLNDCNYSGSGNWVIKDGSTCIRTNAVQVNVSGDLNIYNGRLMLNNSIVCATGKVIFYRYFPDLNNSGKIRFGKASCP